VKRLAALGGLALGLALASGARADLAAEPVYTALRAGWGDGGRLLPAQSERRLWRVPNAAAAEALGLVPVGEHFAVGGGTPEQALALSRQAADFSWRWAPPRAALLDRANPAVRASLVYEDYGLDGSGVIVAIIDTGADLTLPTFQNADGTTRVAWLLSFDEPPLGKHADLEKLYGCSADTPCAVYSAADIDELLARGEAGPRDYVGHGSHVLSTAAGRDAAYPGIAPGAELIVVQSGSKTGAISDGDILLGARFVFDRATEEGKAAVLNVSLGSGFGAHDGTSALEQGLADFTSEPGHIVVAAAGNDGELYQNTTSTYPEPLGVHTEVDVPEGTTVRISLLTPATKKEKLTGAAYAWLSLDEGAELSVRFDTQRGGQTVAVHHGEALAFDSVGLHEREPNDYQLAIFNGRDTKAAGDVGKNSIVVALTGSWEGSRVFDLVLEGRGLVRAWLTSTGQVGPSTTSNGMVVPRARTGGTVGVPASSPELIAVGASINRTGWTDYTGHAVESSTAKVGERATFSAAGPNLLGDMKPDLLAPGGYLVAAMSQAADPRDPDNTSSEFASAAICYDSSVECYVVDDQHAVSSGTSMSAPVVSGAVALLLERDATLVEGEVRQLLRAGTRPARGETAFGSWTGTGILDIVGALQAQDLDAGSSAVLPSAKQSRIALANTYASAVAGQALGGYLALRAEDGAPAGGFAAERLRFEVDGGTVTTGEIRAGLVQLALQATPGSGGKELTVRALFDDEVLASQSVPVGVDALRARLGYEASGGSCQWSVRAPRGVSAGAWFAALGALAAARRFQGRRAR
jgi:subtilisin family serine protease